MNFVLIHFLARLVLGTFLVVAYVVLLQGREVLQLNGNTRNGLSFTFNRSNEVNMDTFEENEPATDRKGLQQRRSYYNMSEENKMAQGVEMRRSNSNPDSIKSQQSAESGWSKEPEPEDKIPGQPSNFGTVVPGVYRSSYPKEEDYPFLQKLGLKTIVTLVDKDVPETFVPFMEANGIRHRQITMAGTKKEAIPVQTMAAILQVVHDKKNHPLLIHCNQGRHRTGCVVAITRKVQQWTSERVLEEYSLYAVPKPRDCDIDYISAFEVTDIEHLGLMPLGEASPLQLRSASRPSHLYVVAVVIILMFFSISGMMNRPIVNYPRNPSRGI